MAGGNDASRSSISLRELKNVSKVRSVILSIVRVTILFSQLSVADDDKLVAGQFLQAHRAAGVEFVGGDADLGAEAVLTAIGKARAGVPEHTGTVHFAEEFFRRVLVTSDDGVAVGGAVFCDVIDGFVDAI